MNFRKKIKKGNSCFKKNGFKKKKKSKAKFIGWEGSVLKKNNNKNIKKKWESQMDLKTNGWEGKMGKPNGFKN